MAQTHSSLVPSARANSATPQGALTRREQQVVALVCEGHPNKFIAGALGITEGSVKQHLNRIYKKFGGRKRKELIRKFSQPARP
jgi:DNA-binding NarL/FixJ family response regulator